ncbi:MAG: glycosyl transferase [Bacteroidetes bacterium]|jgi:cellulose synthase/poly-beta-1,6-N-acetylglucosamine synthase-like glycosyltransferase|nr:glycosyl transferase [Bacteroidota bacterium]
MEGLLWIIILITGFLAVLYVGMILLFCYGWSKTSTQYNPSSGLIKVCVIVAARNEEFVINKCLKALAKQKYPKNKLEIIIVDDHSVDNTAKEIQAICDLHSNFRSITAEGTGKKSAIETAIKITNAELILTTDADCNMGEMWVEKMTAFYENSGAGMIVGPVAFEREGTSFEKMQSLELIALMGSTAGSLYFNKAIMCNGANLAYSRSLFNEVNGFNGNKHLASGDDVLLMYKIAGSKAGKIRFIKDPDAVVYTKAKESVAGFIEQRKRWASKGFNVLNNETRIVSLIVYFFSLFILLSVGLSLFASIKSMLYLPFLQICLILFGIKCIIDFLLLFLAASFFKKRQFLYLFLPEQFIYCIYVVIAGFLGTKGSYVWKGRKI